MNYKLIMKNKSIHIQTPSTIYRGENNCDNIEVWLPEFYNDIDMATASVTLNWIFHYDNAETGETTASGNLTKLTLEKLEEKEGYLFTKVPISIKYTQKTGTVELWLEVQYGSSVLLKTNTVEIQINDHVQITEYVDDGQIDLLSNMLVQMQQLVNSCNQVLARATEQADRAFAIAEQMAEMLAEWEEEYGNQ